MYNNSQEEDLDDKFLEVEVVVNLDGVNNDVNRLGVTMTKNL